MTAGFCTLICCSSTAWCIICCAVLGESEQTDQAGDNAFLELEALILSSCFKTLFLQNWITICKKAQESHIIIKHNLRLLSLGDPSYLGIKLKYIDYLVNHILTSSRASLNLLLLLKKYNHPLAMSMLLPTHLVF